MRLKKDNYRSATGVLKVLSQENPWLYRVEVWLLNDKTNRNNWRYENLDAHRQMFANTPILVAYVGDQVGDGHNFRMRRDRSGEEYASFTDATSERIVGWFAEESDIRMETREGTKWIVGVGYIWTWYARELVDMLSEQGAEGMEISIETLVDGYRMDGGTEVFDRYEILGTTILGQGVTPAVAGAKIRAFNDLAGALSEFKLRVASRMTKGVKKDLSKEYTKLAQVGEHVFVLCENKVFLEQGEELQEAAVKLCSGELEADASDVFSVVSGQIAVLQEKLGKEEQKVQQLTSQLAALQEVQKEQRKALVIDALKEKAREIKENADEDMDEKDCEELCENADEFACMEDEEGRFVGDKVACDSLMAQCMEKLLSKKKEKTTFVWGNDLKHNGAEEGFESLLSRINK